MALTPSFSTAQPVGEPSVIRLTDTSTGADAAVTQRRVYIQKADGSYLVPEGTETDYVEWELADTTIDIDCLDKDYGVAITVEWLDVTDEVLYDEEEDAVGFTSYNEDFDYGLTQMMAGNPLLVNDANFFNNKSQLRTLIDSGNQAILRASDLYSAQLCYDAATLIRTNAQYNFY
jgi:hypothetical protein